MKTKLNNEGFTLIEIMVFLLVAAIVLPAIILPYTEGVRELQYPSIFATMSFLAQGIMEEKQPFEYDAVESWSESEFSDFTGYSNEGTVVFVDPADFETETSVDGDYKRLTVTVTREGFSDLTLSMLIARNFEGVEQ